MSMIDENFSWKLEYELIDFIKSKIDENDEMMN